MVGNPELFTGQNKELIADLPSLQTPEGELHLRFYLPSNDEFALPADAIREVMQQSPERITPIPNASPLMLGTMNLRGQIIWVADLGRFLGDRGKLNTDRVEIPIVAIEDQETLLGLAVDRLGEMEWLDVEQLRIASDVPDSVAPYVHGEWKLDGEIEQILRLLDPLAILRSARWAT
jgi:twitching motility protein PilI